MCYPLNTMLKKLILLAKSMLNVRNTDYIFAVASKK